MGTMILPERVYQRRKVSTIEVKDGGGSRLVFQWRNFWVTWAMSFSWKRRMAAMPAAPALRQDCAFSRVIPPRARTGIVARQASANAARPAGRVPGTSLFSKTGAKTARSALFLAAWNTPAGE